MAFTATIANVGVGWPGQVWVQLSVSDGTHTYTITHSFDASLAPADIRAELQALKPAYQSAILTASNLQQFVGAAL